jgi:ABC-type Fe3+ transport system permease subunit
VLFARTAGSPATVAKVLSANAGSIAWSAGLAAVVAVALVLWSSLSTRRSRLEPFWLAALAVPGVIGALGALTLANRLGVQRPLVESGALLALAIAARFAFVAWLPLRDAVPPSQLEAAHLAALSPGRTWRRVVLPSALPRALAAGAIVFALALGEIGPAVLLSPPGRQMVVQHLFNWMHYGYDDTVASLALAMVGAAALMAWMGTYGRRVDQPAHGR